MNYKFEAGDKVSFIHAAKSGRNVNIKSRVGELVSIVNNIARIKYRGRVYECHVYHLRPEGVTNALTDELKKMGDIDA